MARGTMVALLVFLGGALATLSGQTPLRRRWEVSLSGGSSSGRAPDGVRAAMRTSGFGDAYVIPAGCYIIACIDHDVSVAFPYNVGGDQTRTLDVSYALRSWLRVRAQFGGADLGWTMGYHAPWGYLGVRQRVGTTAALLVVGEGVYVGVGPSMNQVRIGPEYQRTRSVARFGTVLHVGLRVPERKRFFVTVTAQYHYIGSVDIGPYPVSYTLTSDSTVTLPRTSVSASYRALRFGFGAAL